MEVRELRQCRSCGSGVQGWDVVMGGADGTEWGWGYVGEGHEVTRTVDYTYHTSVHEPN